jgi:hypothetical protein
MRRRPVIPRRFIPILFAALTLAVSASVLMLSPSSFGQVQPGWFTYHHDLQRTGVDPNQPPVSGTPSLSWSAGPLDGQIYAEPLVVGNQVLIATMANGIYSFDATTGALSPGWTGPTHLGTPVPQAMLGGPGCTKMDQVGVMSTPVIDTASGTLYAVALTLLPDQTIQYVLAAVRLTDGAIIYARPIVWAGFDARWQSQRGALTLFQGRVYVTFGGRDDCLPYNGWVMSAPANNPTGAFDLYEVGTAGVPAEGTGFWNPPGMSIDAAGFLYVTTANNNRDAPPATFDHSESVIRLSAFPMTEQGFFAPTDWIDLNRDDRDLGSVAPALLNDNMLFQIGKGMRAYLVRAHNLPGIGNESFSSQICDGAWGGTAYLPPYLFLTCHTSGVVRLNVTTSGATPSYTVDWFSGDSGIYPPSGPPIIAGGALWTVSITGRTLRGLGINNGADLFPPIDLRPFGTPVHFNSLAAGNGRIYVPVGAQVAAFNIQGTTGATPTPTPTPTGGAQTITFDELPGQDRPLTGEYPAGVIDWGSSGEWWLASPVGPFLGKSISLGGPNISSASFRFVSPKRLVQVHAYNGGTTLDTVTVSCAGQSPATATLAPGAVQTIATGWTAACSPVTIATTNTWHTNFDRLMIDNGALSGTPTHTPTPPAHTPTPTATPTPTRTPTPGGLRQTVTFDNLPGQDRPLTGQYPSGIIDWGTGDSWWLASPWGAFTTKSISLGGPNITNATFTFLVPRRLIQLTVYNGNASPGHITLRCPGQPDATATIPGGSVQTVVTGWTVTCPTVNIGSANAWHTNFDDLVIDGG